MVKFEIPTGSPGLYGYIHAPNGGKMQFRITLMERGRYGRNVPLEAQVETLNQGVKEIDLWMIPPALGMYLRHWGEENGIGAALPGGRPRSLF